MRRPSPFSVHWLEVRHSTSVSRHYGLTEVEACSAGRCQRYPVETMTGRRDKVLAKGSTDDAGEFSIPCSTPYA